MDSSVYKKKKAANDNTRFDRCSMFEQPVIKNESSKKKNVFGVWLGEMDQSCFDTVDVVYGVKNCIQVKVNL